MGYLVARGVGIDVRQRGSGNIGATNVLRTAGWTPAILTLVGDVVKGYLGAWLGSLAGPGPGWPAAATVLVVVGNCWPVFLGFRGGKGVASGLGAFLRLTPWALVPAVVVWVALVGSFRFVSLSSICAVLGLPVAVVVLGYPWPSAVAAVLAAAIVVWRHQTNIGRLLAGTEPRFGQTSRPAAGGDAPSSSGSGLSSGPSSAAR